MAMSRAVTARQRVLRKSCMERVKRLTVFSIEKDTSYLLFSSVATAIQEMPKQCSSGMRIQYRRIGCSIQFLSSAGQLPVPAALNALISTLLFLACIVARAGVAVNVLHTEMRIFFSWKPGAIFLWKELTLQRVML